MSKVSVTIEIDERYFLKVLEEHELKIKDRAEFSEWIDSPEFSKLIADSICTGWMSQHKEAAARPALREMFKTVLENNG